MAVATLPSDSSTESLKQAIRSTSTCSNATLLSLQTLLRGPSRTSTEVDNYTSRRNEKYVKSSAATVRSKTMRATRSKTGVKSATLYPPVDTDAGRLSCQEKLVLATDVFNITLKTLSDAIKAAGFKSKSRSNDEGAHPRLRKDPLQPALSNRVISSPKKSKAPKQPHTVSGLDEGILATAECARLALSCLRVLKNESLSEGNTYRNVQLEQASCVLTGRFISLGLNDMAYKELRALKRRIQHYLDRVSVGENSTLKDGHDEETGKEKISDLLTFTNISNGKSLYGLLVTFQANAMRLISSEPKVSTTQKIHASLQFSNPSSPTNIIMAAFESGSLPSDKTAIQLQLLSNTVLSLCSCTEKSNDTPKEHSKPITILTLQLLSLEIRCLGWQVAGHICDEGREVWDPLSRYLGNFAHQSKEIGRSEFVAIYKTILRLQSVVAVTKRKSSNNSKTSLNSAVKITTVLGQLAQESGCFDEALKLYTEALTPLSVRQCIYLCTIRCKIASVHIQALKYGKSSEISLTNSLLEATSALGLSLKGSPDELDELLVEAAKLKKLSMSWLGSILARDDRCLQGNDVLKRLHEYLHGFIRFLRRYIGHQPSPEAESKDQELFQKRACLSRNVALAAVDSALAIGKLSVTSGRPHWDDILSIFTDCQRLLMTLQCAVGTDLEHLEDDDCGMGLVRLSNLFWSRYLKEKEAGKDSSELLSLLRQCTGLLSNCSPSQRNTGFAALKLERLGHLCLECNRGTESEKAFRQSINDHIGSGILSQISSDTTGIYPHHSCRDPKSNGFALGRVLTAFLKMKMRRKDLRMGIVFDDDLLEPEQNALLLEWQMAILLDLHAHTLSDEYFCLALRTLISKLLNIYSSERYPIRRLRVILRGLRFTLEHPNSLDPALAQKLVDEGTEGCKSSQDLRGDYALERFAAHIKNSLKIMVGFHNGKIGPPELSDAVSSWSSMVQECGDWKALESCIDDTEFWLLQMKALIDYTEVHGLWKHQVSVLELVLRAMELQEAGNFSSTIVFLSRLVSQYCRLGYCKKASGLLARADQYLCKRDISCLATVTYKLAQAEYLLEIADVEKATDALATAQALYEETQEKGGLANCTVQSKILWERLVADAAFIHSRLSSAQGSISHALYFAKLSVRLNCRIWAKIEKLAQIKQQKFQTATINSAVETVTEGLPKLDVSHVTSSDSSGSYSQGAPFWPHVGSHHICLLNLANLSAHHGLFQDAIYYGEQALKMNKTLHANVRQIASQAQLGSHWILSGHVTEGQELLKTATEVSKNLESSIELVSLQMGLAALHRAKSDHDDELQALASADKLILGIIGSGDRNCVPESSTISGLEHKMDKLQIRGSSRRPQQQTATGRRTRAMTASARSSSRKASKMVDTSSTVQSNSLLKHRADILLQQAGCLRALQDFDKAANLLSDARQFAVSNNNKISLHIGETENLLAHAIQCLATHRVYCVLPESTISLPSLQSIGGTAAELSRKGPALRRQKVPIKFGHSCAPKATEDFTASLAKASDCVNDILSTATAVGSTFDSHTICGLNSRISILSHATNSEYSLARFKSAANVNEISRIGAFSRERTAINIDKQLAEFSESLFWPTPSIPAVGLDIDVDSKFTENYIDILPDSWNVLSLSLSADHSEFVVSKLQKGHSPFLLRLPLTRGNSDEEDDQLTFKDGREEMKEIIRLANESAHAARSQTDKMSKKEWWRNRESIDHRLETLLQNIENVWFGGFRGIFSPMPREDSNLAQFASSFHGILDKHLPSRQKGNRATGPRLMLHQDVLALFVGLKDLQDQEDSEDILMDLLYFVVDILQFQGERNAYDEIDFDMMVVETLDALRAYHNAARREQERGAPHHTILILDKALHFFPWESLPSLQGLPVCRVPSLECLRDRVLRFRDRQTDSRLTRVLIDRAKGAYVLNPTGDLKTTQETFERKLSSLDTWTKIVNREPTEEEFKKSLESNDVFLYFGHGSGAQYIRGRTIKRLDRCAVTFLMGCSSGTLIEAGEYEPYGTPMNYLHAGSPALVATLWDVTDKDIDRFASSTFDNWGLVKEPGANDREMEAGSTATRRGRSRGAKASGRSLERSTPETTDPLPVALDEAVAKSRGSCLLKYLNGAAPVIYGVPVFLG